MTFSDMKKEMKWMDTGQKISYIRSMVNESDIGHSVNNSAPGIAFEEGFDFVDNVASNLCGHLFNYGLITTAISSEIVGGLTGLHNNRLYAKANDKIAKISLIRVAAAEMGYHRLWE